MPGLPKCDRCSLNHEPSADGSEAACLETQATALYYLLTRTSEPQRCNCGTLIFWCIAPGGAVKAYDELARPHEPRDCSAEKAETPRAKVDLAALRQNIYLFLERNGDRARCGGPDGAKGGCRQTIYWFTHHTGKKAPYTEHAINHFADCPERAQFRKKVAV